MGYCKKTSYQLGLFLVLLIASSLMTYLYWIKYHDADHGIDDANIYFIYMRNLANGYGFVYNAGGEHVEGFTSVLWVLIGSVFYLFTSKPEALLIFFNVILMTLTIWKACLFADLFLKDKRMISPTTIIITGFILLIPGYVQWCTITIMETGLWSMLLIFLFLDIIQEHLNRKQIGWQINILLLLLVITRPESYLLGGFAIFLRFVLLYYRLGKSFSSAIKPIISSILVFAGTIVTLTMFRMFYFGYPLPNTYYAKISSDHYTNLKDGIIYLQKFFFFYTPHLTLPIISFVLVLVGMVKSYKKSSLLLIFTVIILITFFIPLYTGGDHFRMFRFIQPYLPLFVVFYVLSFCNLVPLKKWFWYIPALASLIGIFFSCRVNYLNYWNGRDDIQMEFWISEGGRRSSKELNLFFQYQHPYPTCGFFAAGSSAYAYQGESIDLLGLNNVKMAHASKIKTGFKNHGSFDKEVFYEQKPDIFLHIRLYNDTSEYLNKGLKPYDEQEWFRDMFKNIFVEEKFRNQYAPAFIFSKKDPRVLQAYMSRDFLERLDTAVYKYEIIH